MDSSLLLFYIPILIFSIILHEIAHGVVALWFGDATAKNAGRLTLNPIPHIDLLGSIILPFLMIISGSPVMLAWAKPVPTNPWRYSNLRWGTFCVSGAGILTNLILGVIASIALYLCDPGGLLSRVFTIGALMNFGLAFFNLLPIPPLDGLSLLASLFNCSEEVEGSLTKIGMMGFMILFIILMVLPIGQFVFTAAYSLLSFLAP